MMRVTDLRFEACKKRVPKFGEKYPRVVASIYDHCDRVPAYPAGTRVPF